MKQLGSLGPFAVGHHTATDARQNSQSDFGKLKACILCGDDVVAANGHLQTAPQGKTVDRRDHRFLHLIHINLHLGAIPGILG